MELSFLAGDLHKDLECDLFRLNFALKTVISLVEAEYSSSLFCSAWHGSLGKKLVQNSMKYCGGKGVAKGVCVCVCTHAFMCVSVCLCICAHACMCGVGGWK